MGGHRGPQEGIRIKEENKITSGDRYYVTFSGSYLDLQLNPIDLAVETKDGPGGLSVFKHIQPRCPKCKSWELDIERPLWEDRESENVQIPCTCDSCGHKFDMKGSIIITGWE